MFLNTLVVVVGVDLSNVITEIEKIGTKEMAESESSDGEKSSDSSNSFILEQKRHRR